MARRKNRKKTAIPGEWKGVHGGGVVTKGRVKNENKLFSSNNSKKATSGGKKEAKSGEGKLKCQLKMERNN